jgi:putative endonuclease
MSRYFVYILQSSVDHSFYIGYSSDISRRLKEHNDGRSRYTRHKSPWILVYSEEFPSKSDAIRREHFLKAQKNREFYEKIIKRK